MEIRDTFPYEARWDSVGLCCAFCRHQANSDEWPNTKRDYRCALHDIPLAAELAPSGFIDGEWFCHDFEDNGRAHPTALAHFRAVRSKLPERVLFGFYGQDGNLKQIPFGELEQHQ